MDYNSGNRSYASPTEIQDRTAFVRNVYVWLMGGFAVAGLGALSAPFIAQSLIAVAGRFFVWVLLIAQFGTLMWASAVSRCMIPG